MQDIEYCIKMIGEHKLFDMEDVMLPKPGRGSSHTNTAAGLNKEETGWIQNFSHLRRSGARMSKI